MSIEPAPPFADARRPDGGEASEGADPADAAPLEAVALPLSEPAPPSARARGSAGMVWLVALLTVVSALLARAVEPSLPGIWVGADRTIAALRLVTALSSQLVALTGAALAIGLVVVLLRTALPITLRALGVLGGAVVVLGVMIASAVDLPGSARTIVAAAAGLLVLRAAPAAVRAPALRAPGLVLAGACAAGLARLVALLVAGREEAAEVEALRRIARASATTGVVLEGISLLIAVAWLLAPAAAGRRRWPGVALRAAGAALVLVAAGLGVNVVARGLLADAPGGLVLFARGLVRLAHGVQPYGPILGRLYVELVAWLVALVVVLVPPRARLSCAVVAFSLVGRGLEAPLGALALVLGALVLVLHPGPTGERPLLEELRHARARR
jgi:hypothetical protein